MFYINQVHIMLAGKYRTYIALLPIKIFNSTGTLPTASEQILNQNFLYEASHCPTNKRVTFHLSSLFCLLKRRLNEENLISGLNTNELFE